MSAWLLILFLRMGTGGAATTVGPFADYASCQAALDDAKDAAGAIRVTRMIGICVPEKRS